MDCKVYMVGSSYKQKPHRKIMMQLFGGRVFPSPSSETTIGANSLRDGVDSSNIAFAVTEALEDAMSHKNTQLSVGSGESYSILHTTVVGLEAKQQLSKLNENSPDIIVASLGAGSNFGGTALPFLQENLRNGNNIRCIAIESASCPKLTKGEYRYDKTDGSGITALQKMYTLGHDFKSPDMHSGGLRFHACSKLISALYHHKLIEAQAYSQTEVFQSAVLFAQSEGIVPAPESAHAIHGAIREAIKAKENRTEPVILFCLSGHGMFDLSAYDDYLSGRMQSAIAHHRNDEIRIA
jgi:tryptophan synthase beta chain